MSSVKPEARLETAQEYLGQFDVPSQVIDKIQELWNHREQLVATRQELLTLSAGILEEAVVLKEMQIVRSEECLRELVSTGLITSSEANIILNTAPAVWHMIFDSTPKEHEGADINISTFTDCYIKYDLARKFPGRNVQVNPVAKEFFQVAESIAKRGAYLLLGTELAQNLASANQSRNQSAELREQMYASTTDKIAFLDTELQNFKGFPLNRILLAIDAFTFAETLPEGVKDIRGSGDEAANVLLPAFIVQDMSTGFGYASMADDIAERARSLAQEDLVNFDLAEAVDIIFEIGSLSMLISDEHFAFSEIRSRRAEQLRLRRVELLNKLAGLSETLTDPLGLILGAEHSYVVQQPSSERLLGALAVENILDMFVADSKNTSGLVVLNGDRSRYAPRQLHRAIESQVILEQAQSEEARVVEITVSMMEIVSRYEISSKKLRSHENGLALRHRVESLHESGNPVFTEDASKQIASLALFRAELPNLVPDIAELRNLWLELQGIKGRRVERSQLLARIDTLLELHDAASAKLLDDNSLVEVWKLAEYLKNPELELAEVPDNEESSPEEVLQEVQAVKSSKTEDRTTQSRTAPASVADLIAEEFAHREPLQAFPPGTTERELREDFERAKRRYMPVPIQWERIESLITLRLRLQERGYAVATHRLSNSRWHTLPHYVIEAVDIYDNRVVVVESPIFGNATYVIPHAEWREIVVEKKEDAKVLGAIPRVHRHGKSIEEHRHGLFDTVVAHLA